MNVTFSKNQHLSIYHWDYLINANITLFIFKVWNWWLEIYLGRRYKTGVMKVLESLGAEVEIEAENSELPFNDEMQRLFRKGEVIAACDASVKDGVMGAY